MFSKFSYSDYFVMPVFAANWPSLLAVFLSLYVVKRYLFKGQNFPIISLLLIFVYCAIFALPFQSYWALKLWSISDSIVLRVIFPLSAFLTTLLVGFLCLKIHARISAWYLARKKHKAHAL